MLRGVSLTVRAGEIASIIGANGAGKSTLLRTVFGMVTPRRGTHPVRRRGDRRPAVDARCCGAASATSRRGAATFPR